MCKIMNWSIHHFSGRNNAKLDKISITNSQAVSEMGPIITVGVSYMLIYANHMTH